VEQVSTTKHRVLQVAKLYLNEAAKAPLPGMALGFIIIRVKRQLSINFDDLSLRMLTIMICWEPTPTH